MKRSINQLNASQIVPKEISLQEIWVEIQKIQNILSEIQEDFQEICQESGECDSGEEVVG